MVVPPFWGKKWPFFPKKSLKTLSWTIFLEAFFVAPIFLDIYLEVFGAWVNHKNISNSDMFKVDIALFAKDGILTQNLCHGENFHHQASFIHLFIDINVEI